jgi:glycosyltransferase involved in cell wall biosynthesis
MKVALVHDFLIRWGGAEKVLFDLHKIFPDAPIYTLFYNKQFVEEQFSGIEIKPSYLQKRYKIIRKIWKILGKKGNNCHRMLLPSMPLAAESLDFSDYDLIISSSSGFMKGIIASSKTKHICYLHTPTRWALQDTEQTCLSLRFGRQARNLGPGTNTEVQCKFSAWLFSVSSVLRTFLKVISGLLLINFLKRTYIHFFRIWDFEASQRPDMIIANSEYTKKRIQKYYRREARVIYPGGEMNHESRIMNDELKFQIPNTKYQIQDTRYFIVVSRLSAYKRIDWAIEAFKNLPYNLIIVGDGPMRKKLESRIMNHEFGAKSAKPVVKGQESRVFFAGFIKDRNILLELIKNSIGLIHLAEEDFGLAMVEALKLGKPVIAYNKGGARELIKEGISGEFFTNKQDLSKIIKKMAGNINKYKPAIIKKSVNKFSQEKFEEEVMEHIAHNT